MRICLGTIACIACNQSAASPPVNVAHAASFNADATSLTYQVVVPEHADLFLVTVQVGDNCPTVAPTATTVTYANTGLTRVTDTQGGSCSPAAASSELWQLADPEVGTDYEVVVTLAGSAQSMQSGAMVFSGAGALGQPVAMTAETAMAATVTVPSEPGDLVVSFIGEGLGNGRPQNPAMGVYSQAESSNTTLNNTAASVSPAASGSTTTMTWDFGGGSDDWQMLAVAI